MNHFLRSRFLAIACVVVVLTCNRCLYVSAWIMSKEEKKTMGKWKTGNYKTRIQRRAGWAGPYCYYCRVKEKRLGGLYYRKIVNEPFSNGVYSAHTIKFPLHKTDTIAVDLFKNSTFLIKSSSSH